MLTNYDNVGLETEPIHSGAVSEEIYNQYNIGDIYWDDNNLKCISSSLSSALQYTLPIMKQSTNKVCEDLSLFV